MKEKELKFIKEFTNINITDICKELGVQPNNVYAGKAKKETYSNIRYCIYRELFKIILQDLTRNVKPE